jgi:hypothetical protein
MKILITDHGFNLLGGAEWAALDLARALRRRGHTVRALSLPIGEIRHSVAGPDLPVVFDLADLDIRPDIIHAQHFHDAVPVIAGLLGVPAIFHCHGGGHFDTPPKHPRIYRYFTMTETLAARLAVETGIPRSDVDVIPNAVDLIRFATFRTPRPLAERALIYGNTIRPNYIVSVIEEAVAMRGLALDRVGRRIGLEITNPEAVLPGYDIVFASGKSAIDALASGCAVIVVGLQGCGEMVREGNFDKLRAANFTIPVNSPRPVAARVSAEIARYDPESAASVTRRIRREADIELTVGRVERIYQHVIETHAHKPQDPGAENKSLGRYLRELTPVALLLEAARQNLEQVTVERAASRAATQALAAL